MFRSFLLIPLLALAFAGCQKPLASKVPFTGTWEHTVLNESGERVQLTHLAVATDQVRFRIDEKTGDQFTVHLYDGQLIYTWGNTSEDPKVWVREATPDSLEALAFWLDRPKNGKPARSTERVCGLETQVFQSTDQQPAAAIASSWWVDATHGIVLKKSVRVVEKPSGKEIYAATYECRDITTDFVREEALEPPSQHDVSSSRTE